MQWWEIYVQVPEPFSDTIGAYLQELGSEAIVVYDHAMLVPAAPFCLDTTAYDSGWTVLYGALPACSTLADQLMALQRWLNICMDARRSPAWKLCCRLLDNQDYLTQWQQFFQPLTVADQLTIRPSWDTSPLISDVAYLTLDPGLAFGTGAHPTTRMCLHLLVQYQDRYRGETVLDIGCGSGILSLAAVRLGARTTVGVDIDAQAVTIATQNAARNALQEHSRFLHGSWDTVPGQFALLVANIYLGPIIDMLPSCARRLTASGVMILSGIIASQEKALQTSLHDVGLMVQSRLVEDDWVALAVGWTHQGTQGGSALNR